MRVIIVFALLLTLSAQASAASKDSYLCLTEGIAGFVLSKNGDWEPQALKGDDKFIVRPIKKDDEPFKTYFYFGKKPVTHIWSKVGNTTGMGCYEYDIDDFEFYYCEGLNEKVHFNAKTLKFWQSYPAGLLTDKATLLDILKKGEGIDTPSLSQGSCSKI